MERGILYAPDYVINAGGVIAVAEPLGPNAASNTIARTRAIGNTLSQIFTDAQKSGKPTAVIADRLAEQRFMA